MLGDPDIIINHFSYFFPWSNKKYMEEYILSINEAVMQSEVKYLVINN